MEYIPINGQKEYCDEIRELSEAMDKDKQTPDFVEATIFNKHEAVLMAGHFANFFLIVLLQNIRSWTNWGMFNDLGVYGVPGFNRDVGGYPFVYADIFMDSKEFEEMFDLADYEKARAKYHANAAFPHLYDNF
ncbi:hypothetical protein DAPPUDRAFT_248706 [Daphnia pulex]|uniref:Uncharacterized protein n=1 Tax=Daphnia pulex TaxID=6669 RepID=E9GV21_DAPPU|nr:hypothetical protein DAPPUDRAFT_248706 [Daphnia pulex]|eukprot:EFX76689.1 hypothetical protein DAPPUDRAFT_248706 [Daphnia pulex]